MSELRKGGEFGRGRPGRGSAGLLHGEREAAEGLELRFKTEAGMDCIICNAGMEGVGVT